MFDSIYPKLDFLSFMLILVLILLPQNALHDLCGISDKHFDVTSQIKSIRISIIFFAITGQGETTC